jgi:DnaJ-domain-containing protein 1
MISSILEAVKVLNLQESSSLKEINESYKTLLFKWHPDRCKGDPEESKLMTEKIILSYKVIREYCYSYRFSFSEESLDKSILEEDPEEFWNKKFGHDPLWGYMK